MLICPQAKNIFEEVTVKVEKSEDDYIKIAERNVAYEVGRKMHIFPTIDYW